MTDTASVLMGLTEDELDTLVSVAIHRAEILDELQSPTAQEAWHEVMVYEERLAAITRPEEIPGGVARVGAVTAALAAGRRIEALRLSSCYLAEPAFPPERRAAIQRAFHEDQERLARREHDAERARRRMEAVYRAWQELDTVVLDRDLPEHGLRRGDLGAVVKVYEPDGLEVEFVTASGRTQALVTLRVADVRAVRDEDLISVRTLTRGAA